MRRRRLIILALGCVIVATLVSLLWPRQKEPEYNGIPLSTYLDRAHESADHELTQAIKHMGTNALPFLIRAVKYEPPLWRRLVSRTAPNWPARVYNTRFAARLLRDKAAMRTGSSVIAFGILGADADSALDELRRIEKSSKNPATSDLARECIRFITERITIDAR